MSKRKDDNINESSSPLDEIELQEKKISLNQHTEEQVVVLRPIWKVILAALFGAIIILVIYNLTHTLQKIKHPTVREKKSTLTTASNIDTHWYSDEKIRPQKKTPLINHPDLSSDSLNTRGIQDLTPNANGYSSNHVDADEEIQKAMSASITSNQIIVDITGDTHSQSLNTEDKYKKEAQATNKNNLNSKEESILLEKKISPYVLNAGTIIPGILISGINSDLPGQVCAQVRNPVYDSTLGKYLLVPQGSKLIGSYDSKICFGQKRVFLIWQRIILPNGDSIRLGEMPASDTQGYSGVHDQVDSHYGSLFSSALLMSILSVGAQVASPEEKNSSFINPGQALSQSVGLHLSEMGSQVIAKGLEVQPTLNIRPGYLFNITVTKDIVFDQPY